MTEPPAQRLLRPLVWVSRTLPAARDSAGRLAAHGYATLVSPLLRVAFARSAPDLRGVGTLVFTSRNGVAAFVARASERRFTVFAVGDATADAARRAGFPVVASAAGDVGDLRRLMLEAGRRGDGVVLRVGAEEPAGTLAADLAAAGFAVADWPAYRTVAIGAGRVLAQIRARGRDPDAVLIYSPKAARRLSSLCEARSTAPRTIVCISAAAAAELPTDVARRARVAERPDEASLFAALGGRPV